LGANDQDTSRAALDFKFVFVFLGQPHKPTAQR
jgi:hypothetical protein